MMKNRIPAYSESFFPQVNLQNCHKLDETNKTGQLSVPYLDCGDSFHRYNTCYNLSKLYPLSVCGLLGVNNKTIKGKKRMNIIKEMGKTGK